MRRINEAAKTAELYRDVEKCVQKYLPKGVFLDTVDFDDYPHGSAEFVLKGAGKVYIEWDYNREDPEIITYITVDYNLEDAGELKSIHMHIEELVRFMNSGRFIAALEEAGV